MSLTDTVTEVAESLSDTISSTASRLAEEAGNVAQELKNKVPSASSSKAGKPWKRLIALFVMVAAVGIAVTRLRRRPTSDPANVEPLATGRPSDAQRGAASSGPLTGVDPEKVTSTSMSSAS